MEHQAHPPSWTLSACRHQFEKTPPLLDIHRHPPPLGHCPRDVIRPPKNWKTPPSCGTKLLKGGTKSLGWATGGGGLRPPLATGLLVVVFLLLFSSMQRHISTWPYIHIVPRKYIYVCAIKLVNRCTHTWTAPHLRAICAD